MWNVIVVLNVRWTVNVQLRTSHFSLSVINLHGVDKWDWLYFRTSRKLVSDFWAAYFSFSKKSKAKGIFFFSSFSFGTGFYPGVLKYSSSCSFSIKVNVEEGKCGSRHLTSFINEYLKLRNKWSWNLKK